MLPNSAVTASGVSGGSKKYPNLLSTLFVNNIDPSVDREALSGLFGRYGATILSVTLNKDTSANNKSFGFIVFSDVKQAEFAMQKFQYYKLGNYELVIMFATNKPKLKQEGKLFVKNIPLNVKHSELHDLFAKISPDLVVHIAYDDKHKNSLVYGYVHYFNPNDAIKALETLQGCEIAGEKLEISQWLSKDDRRQPQSQEKKSLYVGNIPLGDKDTIEHAIKSLFSNYGEIEALTLRKAEKAGFYSAILAFKDINAAKQAYEALTNFPTGILGYKEPLYINWHLTREERNKERQKEANRDNLYLRNIKMEVTDEVIRQLFGKYGEIKDVELRVWSAPNDNKEAKFAFISYKDPEDAVKALDKAPEDPAIQDLFLSKTKIYIRFFMPKNEREQEVKKVKQTQQQQYQPQRGSQIKQISRYRKAEPMGDQSTPSHIKSAQVSMPQVYPKQKALPPIYGNGMNGPPMLSSSMRPAPMNAPSGLKMYQPYQANQAINRSIPFDVPKSEKHFESKMSKGEPEMMMKKKVSTKEDCNYEMRAEKSKKSTVCKPLTNTVAMRRTTSKIETEHDEEVQMIIENNQYDDAQKQAMLARIFENKQDKPHAKE